jgi:hypothetical protein
VRVNVSESLRANADGLGSVKYKGSPKDLDIKSSGLRSVKEAR